MYSEILCHMSTLSDTTERMYLNYKTGAAERKNTSTRVIEKTEAFQAELWKWLLCVYTREILQRHPCLESTKIIILYVHPSPTIYIFLLFPALSIAI